MKYLALIVLLAACSNVNRESQDYYYKGEKVRHGLVPKTFTMKTSEKKDSDPLVYQETLAKKGEALYKTHCLACHGPQGHGNGPKAEGMIPAPVDLVKVVNEVPRFEFFMSLSQWQAEMPGWKNMFTRAETKELSHYLKKLAKGE